MFSRDYLRVLFLIIGVLTLGECRKKAFTAQVVEDIVQNEIARKMPAALGSSSSSGSSARGKKKSLTGVHLKEATDAINKLVDESIVDRVQEAEKEVSQMLLKSIEHHIQDAGKVLLKQDENTCRDKLDSCETLAESGVCESSKDAMVNNCPMTCNFCGMLEDLKNQAKSEKDKEKEEKELLKIKKKKHKKARKHKKRKHHHVVKSSNLAPEEVRLIHENMLDQAIDHANLPMAVSEGVGVAPEAAEDTQGTTDTREYEADEAAAKAEEEKELLEKEQQEIEAEKEKEREKKKKAAHKQYKAVQQAAQGNYANLPPNPAGMDPITPNIQAMQAEVAQMHAQNLAIQNQYQQQQQTSTEIINPGQPQYNQYISGVPNTMGASKRNDFTETELLKANSKAGLDKTTQKKATEKQIMNKLMKVDLSHSKSKTDMKLKHEIETMVDKAFGELLLKK